MANIVDLPTGFVVGTIDSPQYMLRRPEIINPDLVPNHFRAFCENLLSNVQAPAPVQWSVIPDAIVEGPGLVYDRDMNLIRESIHETSERDIDIFTWSVSENIRTGSIPRREGVTLLCEKAGIGNYGHWLVEMLPIIHLMLPEIFRWGWKIRLPAASAEMTAVMETSLELLGIPKSKIAIRVAGPEVYERLVIVTGLTLHGQFYSPRVIETAEFLSDKIRPGPPTDIWVTRSKSSRKLLCEEDVVTALAKKNWTIVDPSQMTLRHQIAVFKGARRIAGVTGAGLTNLVFAPRGASIISFMPSQMPDIFYWVLSNLKEHQYREIRCPEAAELAVTGNWDTPIEMDVASVLQYVE
ncbi:glycosyltransferase family 61 protein [Acidisoma sp.]|uniref:glycosyltransferase family 61 protein n=1 Tax=Acidisoma sp. TaxID=1872115 RepID=UPI003AFF6D58